MATNKTKKDILYPELSYKLVGICFETHNELGRFAREKQYADLIEKKMIERRIPYKRELSIGESGNIVDFLIDDRIVLELKTVRRLSADNYRQIKNYLEQSRVRLGLVVNFRNKFIDPKRVLLPYS